MTIRDIVLRFLKDNTTGQNIDLSSVLAPFDNDRTGIFVTLSILKKDGLIDISKHFGIVSGRESGKYRPLRQCNLQARLTPAGETYCKEHLINFDSMTDEEKMHKVLEYAIKTKPDQFSWDVSELTPAFDNALNEYEVQYLCQQLLDNGDVVDCITKDGFAIGINEKSKAAFHGKKYLKRSSNTATPPSIQIGTVQQVVSSTIHGGISQSSDSSSNKSTIEPKQINKNPINIKRIIKYIFWVLGAILTVYGIYEMLMKLNL